MHFQPEAEKTLPVRGRKDTSYQRENTKSRFEGENYKEIKQNWGEMLLSTYYSTVHIFGYISVSDKWMVHQVSADSIRILTIREQL